MTAATKIWTRIDYEKDGKQVGWLQYPHSVTRSAYGNISIPIAVIKNGRGPTCLLMAGNHGDEFEGQIALTKLVRSLEPSDIQGRVIIMTAANLPAALASARVSPIDGANMNRVFPGDPDAGPTAAIAHYIDSVLFPMAQYHHDLHAGGSSLQYLPFASMRLGADEDLNRRAEAALLAFGAPLSFVWAFTEAHGIAATAAIKRGLVSLAGEFGGSGSVSIPCVSMIERGLRNLLAHIGIVDRSWGKAPERPTRLVELRGIDYFVYAEEAGLFEPATELGDTVSKGQLCGHLHFPENPARPAIPHHFLRDGLVVCKRHPARVERGDCVAHLATDVKA